jgi:hypothetical protein
MPLVPSDVPPAGAMTLPCQEVLHKMTYTITMKLHVLMVFPADNEINVESQIGNPQTTSVLTHTQPRQFTQP